MARINTVMKSRKEKVCGSCGKVIPVGSKYYYVDFYSGRTAVRCANCGFKPYETTENPYLQELYRIQYDYGKQLDTLTKDDSPEQVRDDIVSDLESLRDELQDRFDNIPEQLQYGDAGSLLQERIDSLDDAISNIENTEAEDYEDWKDNNGYGEDDFDSWCEENGVADEEDFEEYKDEHKQDFENEAEEKYNEVLSDFASEIEGYLDEIAQ